MPRQHTATRKVAILVAGAVLVGGACSTNREVTRPEPVPVTEERVAGALLTIEDLPDTFTAAADGTPIDAEIVPEHECDDAIADLEPKEVATADFTGSGARLTSTVAWFPDAGEAVDQLFRDLAEDCEQVVATDGTSVRAGALDYGVLSDDTLALKFEIEPTSGPIEERDVIVIREDDLVSIVRLTGPRPSDKGLLDSAVRVAIGRLALLAEETG